MLRNIFILCMISFIIGWCANGIVSSLNEAYTNFEEPSAAIQEPHDNQNLIEEGGSDFILLKEKEEKKDIPSPYDWIQDKQIIVDDRKVTINIKDAEWAGFTNTKSMDPIIDQGSNAIQIIPKKESDVHIGDIASYLSEFSEGIIIHRVIEKGVDEKGTYFIMKGDNNPSPDPGRIRFDQIKRILVAVIY